MAPFAPFFTRPTWSNLLVLVAGAVLSPGRRTVTSALSSMGLREVATFTNFHRGAYHIRRACWVHLAVIAGPHDPAFVLWLPLLA